MATVLNERELFLRNSAIRFKHTAHQALLGEAYGSIHVGGMGDIIFHPNKEYTGGSFQDNDGEIGVAGTYFFHPDGKRRTITGNTTIFTYWENASPTTAPFQDPFYIVYNDTSVNADLATRFGAGTWTNNEFFPAKYTSGNWIAVDDAGIEATASIVASDCVLGIGKRISGYTGITSFSSLLTTIVDPSSISIYNFNNSNDRISSAVVTPSVASDGTAIDHVTNVDGSVNISFEWTWAGSEADIDGFIVYINDHGVTAPVAQYTEWDSDVSNNAVVVYTIEANRRAFLSMGVAANHYYTFGVRAYRYVDPDISPSQILKSTVAQPAVSGETGTNGAYRPASNVSFSGQITDSVGTVLFSDSVNWQPSDIDPAAGWLNANVTIDSAGNLIGGGGGQVTIGGLGYTGDLNASADLILVPISGNTTVTGNKVTKTGGGSGWQNGAWSKDGYLSGVFVTFTVPNTVNIVVGFDEAPSGYYINMAMGLVLNSSLELRPIFNNVQDSSIGSYTSGDVITIIYDRNNISYYKNGTLLHSKILSTTVKLFLDIDIYGQGDYISNIKFGPMSSNSSVLNGGPLVIYGKHNLATTDGVKSTYVSDTGTTYGTALKIWDGWTGNLWINENNVSSSISPNLLKGFVQGKNYRWYIRAKIVGSITNFHLGAYNETTAAQSIPQVSCVGLGLSTSWKVLDLGPVTPSWNFSDQVRIYQYTEGGNESTGYVLVDWMYFQLVNAEDGATLGADWSVNVKNRMDFSETFESGDLSKWEWYQGGGNYSIVTDSSAIAGGKVLRAGDNSGNDEVWLIHKENIAFDSSALYRIRVRARKNNGTTNVVYFGVAGILYDGVTLVNAGGTTGSTAYGGQHYIAAAFASPSSSWTEYTGYFKGSTSSGAGALAPNPYSPAKLYDTAKYFRPLILLNYTSDTGIMDVDYFIIDRLDGAFSAVNTITDSNASNYVGVSSLAALSAYLGDVTISTAGALKSGKTAYSDTAAGYFMDYNSGTPRFVIGNSNAYMQWTGSNLELKYDTTNVTTTGPKTPTLSDNGFTTNGGAAATAIVYFNTNGTTTSLGSPNWYLPTTSNIGSSYYIRFTLLSNETIGGAVATIGGSATNTWMTIGSQRSLSMSKGSSGTGESIVSFLYNISTTSSDSGIISSGMVNLWCVVDSGA